jgi:hypothetical protein
LSCEDVNADEGVDSIVIVPGGKMIDIGIQQKGSGTKPCSSMIDEKRKTQGSYKTRNGDSLIVLLSRSIELNRTYMDENVIYILSVSQTSNIDKKRAWVGD